ncbi:Peroxidasin -like protein [Halotydeus destructor]|nr:Peroxidasin -like protein [Halotydeus destructor]
MWLPVVLCLCFSSTISCQRRTTTSASASDNVHLRASAHSSLLKAGPGVPVKLASLAPLAANIRVSMPNLPQNELNSIIEQATLNVKRRLEVIEPSILASGAVQIPGSPGWFQAASSRTKVVAKNFSREALITEEASKIISNTYRLNREQITYGLPGIDLRSTSLGSQCPRKGLAFPCHPGRYRSFSGHCNNVQNPDWGSSTMAFIRYAPPHYADGVSLPRRSLDGDLLPSARLVSQTVHKGSDVEHPHVTTLTAFFAEFVLHDIAHAAQAAGHRGHRIKCCGLNDDMMHPECLPVSVPANDAVFKDKPCMEYVRTCPALKMGCTLGPREQINQVSSFLDGSTIYGSSEEEAQSLRTFKGGEIKSQRVTRNGKTRELLPAIDNVQDCRSQDKAKCFKSGDIRVNENMGLTLMHTLFMREHNRIARNLGKMNSHWDDEQIFEETRRLVGAQIQHITFHELLPSILGQEVMDEFGLRPETSGYYSGYDIDANPTVDNALATSVYPFLYSMMPAKFERYSSQLKMVGTQPMGDTYFNPSDLYDGNKLDEYLMGMVSQNAHNSDLVVSNEMMSFATKEPFDLVAIIIQQGRDHGIPGYTEWRKLCNIQPSVNNFKDLEAIMNKTVAQKFTRLYKHVQDIDLFSGGLAEAHIRGAMVGPTFACLLGRQFHYLRRGDRYWYENDMPPSSFTREQLSEIRKASLARLICHNGDEMDFVQPTTTTVSDAYLNAFQYCSNIPKIDLKKWRDDETAIHIPITLLKDTVTRAKRQATTIREAERRSYESNIGVASGQSPQGSHYGFLRPKRQAQVVNNMSLILELTTNNVVRALLRKERDREAGRSLDLEIKDLVKALPMVDLTGLIDNRIEVPKECVEDTFPCDHTNPFRSATGWCNNLKHPEYGMGMRVFDRFLEPKYEDGVGSPRRRTAKSQKLLPPPRLVSTSIHNDVSAPHIRYALVTMQWGQFLDHDLTFTPMNMGADGSILDCTACDSPKTVHPECLPMPIPLGDPHFPAVKNGQKQCLHFARSLNAQTKLGPREQMNQVTSYLDSSNVYGSEICEAKMLRSFVGGKMNTTAHPVKGFKDLLPQTSTHPECKAPSGLCFEAGDMRSSEQPALACMHTMMLREHNRIVEQLKNVNPHWSDEQLYQNGRKIVGAIAQRITYNEFLPRVLGWDYLMKFKLNLLTSGYYDGYDSKCSGTIYNEFAAAVFRFGHSLIKPAFERLGRSFRAVEEPLRLRKAFFNSDMLYSAGAIDNIIRGLVTTSIETLDNSITKEVTNHLFEEPKKPHSGMDLISLNLQRARDHGIPPYNDFREKCNLTRVKSFEELRGDIPPTIVDRLKKVYESVDDIDLFTGGLVENALHGGSVGPTFGCVLATQFQRLRKCDRFWHETADPFVRFTENQLSEIRKMSLAKIFCENSDAIDSIQRVAMDLPDPFLNPRVPCKSLPAMDLSHWSDRGSRCTINGKLVDAGKAERISPCVTCVCTKEGAICNSIKVKNCLNLMDDFSKKEILEDSVCKVQCSFTLRLHPSASARTSRTSAFGFTN